MPNSEAVNDAPRCERKGAPRHGASPRKSHLSQRREITDGMATSDTGIEFLVLGRTTLEHEEARHEAESRADDAFWHAESLKREIARLKDELKAKDDELQKSRANNAAAGNPDDAWRIAELEAENQEAWDLVAEQEAELDVTQTVLHDVTAAQEELDYEYEELKRKHGRLEQEHEQLEQDHQRLKFDKERHKDALRVLHQQELDCRNGERELQTHDSHTIDYLISTAHSDGQAEGMLLSLEWVQAEIAQEELAALRQGRQPDIDRIVEETKSTRPDWEAYERRRWDRYRRDHEGLEPVPDWDGDIAMLDLDGTPDEGEEEL